MRVYAKYLFIKKKNDYPVDDTFEEGTALKKLYLQRINMKRGICSRFLSRFQEKISKIQTKKS